MPFAVIPRVTDLLPGAIKGLWTIGDTSSWHVEIGTHPNDGSPSANESGIRLYGADGVTVLIDLTVGAAPSITGALIRTAATGQRVQLDGNAADRIELFSGNAAETAAGELTTSVQTVHGHTSATTQLLSPNVGGGQASLIIARPTGLGSSAYAAVLDELGAPAAMNAGTYVDGAGNPLPRWSRDTTQRQLDARATVTATVDVNNGISLTHDLGALPVYAAIIGNDDAYQARWRRDLSDASQATFRPVRDHLGALLASGTNISVSLWAIG